MTVFQDGLLAFFCSVGVTTILWLAAGLFFRAGRPGVPDLLLVLPLRGDAPAMEEDVRTLCRLRHQVPEAAIVLVDCGLSEETRNLASYLAWREEGAELVNAREFQLQ